jgi:hypothetical protein
LEPLAASVYFLPEAMAGYEALGLDYGEGYFSSRSASMGQLPGSVVAATFGVFYPPMVERFVAQAWAKTSAPAVLEARHAGAQAGLARVLGAKPDGAERATSLLRRAADAAPVEGRPLFAGLRSLPWPGDTVGDLWRAADQVREHRGDAHVAAWVTHGLRPLEVMLLSEAWNGLPLNSYLRTRGWPQDDVLATIDDLRARGLLEGEGLTDAGRALRESVEATTDRAEAPVVDALGDDVDELFDLLQPWAQAIVADGAFPANLADFGAHVRSRSRS